MVLQVFDHAFFPAFAVTILQLDLNDSLSHSAHGQEHGGDSEENQKRIKDSPGMAEWPHLLIANGGNGRQGHVEAFEPGVAFDQAEADCAHDESEAKQSSDEDEAAKQTAAHRGLREKDRRTKAQP